MVVFFATLLMMYDPVLALIGVGIAFLNLAVTRWVARRLYDLNSRVGRDRGRLYGTSMNGLQIIETLKATGSEHDFFSRWAGVQAKVMNGEQNLGAQAQLLDAAPRLLGALNTVAILGLGSLRVMDGHLSMGLLVAFQTLMASFLAPINDLVRLGSLLPQVEADMSRLDDVLEAKRDNVLTTAEEAHGPPRLSGEVQLRDISFGYSRLEPPLVEGFHLTVAPGRRVALVGSSGSGKSTIAKMIAGLNEPWSGSITFDGCERKELPRAVLTSSVAMVDQDIALFEGTVRENLTLWDGTVPEATVVAAADDAAVHEDIATRAGGSESVVEEGGRNFSGGQRQRLEIARALIGNPSVLVLDEATSALDPLTEARIDANLRRRGCTCIIVAHRLSTIRDCDEILVMERGKVVQRGSHDELIGMDGPYASLVKEEH
jgi:ABC-type bacteriocin/lantibiotic exporter with double-glycine peptidase domain